MNLNRPTSTVQPKLDPGLDRPRPTSQHSNSPIPNPILLKKVFRIGFPNKLWKAPTNPIPRATIY